MGVLTKVLNVVVVALAITAVIQAGKLDKKRAQIVGRGDAMAKTVNASTTDLAKEFGTATKGVSTKSLDKTKDLKAIAGVLANVKKQATEVIAKKKELDTNIAGLEETVVQKNTEITGLNTEVATQKQNVKTAENNQAKAEKAKEKVEGELETAQISNDKLTKDNESKNAEIGTLKSKNSAQSAKLAEIEAVKAANDAEIAKLKEILGMGKVNADTGETEEVDLSFYQPGEARTLGLLKGTVTNINQNLGFIILDIGSQTTVIQKIGTADKEIVCGLKKGLSMTVERDGKYVTEITLVKVEANLAIANIITARNKEIKEGDKVFFDRGELDKIEASQNK